MNNNIIISSPEKFYESYEQYFLTKYNINNFVSNCYYVFFCRDSNEIFCIKGKCIEEIYYKILFKIPYNSCDDIYVYEYPLEQLEDPIKLLHSHYFESDFYIFEEIKFITDKIDYNFNEKVSICLDSSEKFYESYKKYCLFNMFKNKKKEKKIYVYILISTDSGDIFSIKGNSLEEIYYIILTKIDIKCWDNIYDLKYPIEELKDPINLFKKHYLDSRDYLFEEIQFF
jgi:hypothetical protein